MINTKNTVQTIQNTVNTNIHSVLPKHPHITKQVRTTTVQVKTNTVQDIPK